MKNSANIDDDYFMGEALKEAAKCAAKDEVPVGAVLVHDGKIVARSGNTRETGFDPTGHAEIQALRKAAKKQKHWNLTGTKLYVTLEPCPMCAGALMMARVAEVVYATPDPKGGAESLGINVLANPRLNHRLKIRCLPDGSPLRQNASEALSAFFRNKRKAKK